MKKLVLLLLVLPTFAFAQPKKADEKKEPKKPATPLAEARQRWLRGNYEEARTQFEKLLDDEKTRVAAAVGISRTYRSEGDYAKAQSTLEEALKKDADQPDLLANHADVLYHLGQWDAALKEAETVIKAQKDHFLARWVKARFIRDTGEVVKADDEMRWFVRTYTQRDRDDKPITDPDELVLVGQAAAEYARWHSLGDQFRFLINDLYPDAAKFDPDLWQAEYNIGLLLLEKYNRPDAEDAFNNALKINPKCAEATVGLGHVALIEYKLKEADTHADAALKLNPKLLDALWLKADILLAGGEYPAAKKLLEQAKTINPRSEQTLARLAAIARMMKQPDVVKELIATVEKSNPKPGVFYHEFGKALDERKLYREAEVYLKKSVTLHDKLPAAKASLGMLYLRLGNEEEATKLLDQAWLGDKFNVRVSNSRKVLTHLKTYETIETKHYTLRFDPKTDKLLATFLAEYMETVHDALTKDFGYEPEGRTLVELFNSHEMFSGRTVGLPDLHTIGACTGKVVTMASPKAKGVPRVFNWGRVIRHELVHIFNLAQTEFQCPHWLTEGLAVRNEGGNRPPQWSAALRDRFEKNDLLNLDNILLAFVRPKSQDEWALAYCQSHLYVEYMIKTYGIESVGPMLNAFRDGLDTGAALKKVCKVDKDVFEKGYKGYVTDVVKSIPSGAKKSSEKPMTFDELKKAHENDPDNVDTAALLADQYSRRKMAADARKMVDDVLKKKPGHPLASIVKARLLSAGGDEDAAATVLADAVKLNPDDPRLILMEGRLALEKKDYPKAAVAFERGRKTSPLDGEWLALLIDIYTKTENTEKLTDVLIEQVGNDPDDLKNRIQLTKLHLQANRFAQAAEVAYDALRIDVTSQAVQEVLIEALTGLKKMDEVAKLKERFGPSEKKDE